MMFGNFVAGCIAAMFLSGAVYMIVFWANVIRPDEVDFKRANREIKKLKAEVEKLKDEKFCLECQTDRFAVARLQRMI